MKIGTLAAILAISSLLPIFAQKLDDNKDTAGSTCENELGQCIDTTDSHKCMSPLAMLDCPDGKKCCKPFPKDYDSADLPPRKERCATNCPSCAASTDEIITHIESTLTATMDKLLFEVAKDNRAQHKQLYCALQGYLPYEDSCYFISTSRETWSNAKDKCVEKGGNLVKIDDDKEFLFLRGKITEKTWIGLSDTQVEGQFIWVADGSPLTTQAWWETNQPDNHQNNEDCVHYHSGYNPVMLNDLPCTRSHLYICEMRY